VSLPDEEEIWQRIKRLQNKDIWTIQKRKKNRILSVSTSDITIDGRITRPTREDVQVYCKVLVRDRMITKENRPSFGWSGGHKTGRIIMAILASALPEYVEAFPQDNPYSPGLSGIRLRG